MGFIDLSGALGRQFGSIGLALNEIYTRISITPSKQLSIVGDSTERAAKCVEFLLKKIDLPHSFQLEIETAIPEHVGLGSGTQMSLAVGMAVNAYFELNLSIREIAALTDRGKRSGIGIGVFEQGGLVVDGGRGQNTITPPVISHLDVPEHWCFILVFDQRGQGLHGNQEINAFKALPGFPRREAEQLCYQLMMQGLPAVAERDIVRFGEVITQLQKSVGEHFSPAQGGVFASQEVDQAIRWLQAQGAVAIGQTSWGPTGFCAIDGVAIAESLIKRAEQQFAQSENIHFVLTSARNKGGEAIVQ